MQSFKSNLKTSNAEINPAPKLNKPVLQAGIKGQSEAVLELQKLLKHWGIYAGSLDGSFDLELENAVKNFQHRVFLEEDGIVRSFTWEALYTGAPVNMPVLKQGSQGKTVVLLQRVLHNSGDFGSVINTNFGPRTDAAVRSFQKRSGLVVDGIVGSKTWFSLSKVPH